MSKDKLSAHKNQSLLFGINQLTKHDIYILFFGFAGFHYICTKNYFCTFALLLYMIHYDARIFFTPLVVLGANSVEKHANS